MSWRAWGVLFLLAACTPATPIAQRPHARCPLPTCPQCSEPDHPPDPVPECPAALCPRCPTPPPPLYEDWYCFTAKHRTKDKQTSYCLVSEAVCQAERPKVRRALKAIVNACTPAPVAHCFQLVEPATHSYQGFCTLTVAQCESVRDKIQTQVSQFSTLSPCQPMRNEVPFRTYEDFEAHRYQE